MTDLHLSPKFANYLRSKGQLEALVNSLKQFRERQNYPFELKDKRIIRQSLGKIYGEILGKLSFSGEVKNVKKEFQEIKKFLLEEIEKDVDRVYGVKPKTTGQEILEEATKESKKEFEKIKKAPRKEPEERSQIPIIEE